MVYDPVNGCTRNPVRTRNREPLYLDIEPDWQWMFHDFWTQVGIAALLTLLGRVAPGKPGGSPGAVALLELFLL